MCGLAGLGRRNACDGFKNWVTRAQKEREDLARFDSEDAFFWDQIRQVGNARFVWTVAGSTSASG